MCLGPTFAVALHTLIFLRLSSGRISHPILRYSHRKQISMMDFVIPQKPVDIPIKRNVQQNCTIKKMENLLIVTSN